MVYKTREENNKYYYVKGYIAETAESNDEWSSNPNFGLLYVYNIGMETADLALMKRKNAKGSQWLRA